VDNIEAVSTSENQDMEGKEEVESYMLGCTYAREGERKEGEERGEEAKS